MMVFLLMFSLYMMTAAPVLYLGDSGGFAAAAYSLGPAHPPGYFLYVQIAKAFTMIPIGNIPYRLSVMSGTFSALSALILFKTLLRITGSKAASYFAVSAVYLTELVWGESVMPEVYSLNLFICSIILYLTVQCIYEKEKTFKNILLSLFAIGIGTANHHTVLIMLSLPAFALLVNFRHIEDKPRLAAFSSLLFIAGSMCNSGVLIRGLKDILYNHAMAADAEGLIAVLLRKHYGGDTLSAVAAVREASGWMYGIKNSLSFVMRDLWYISPFAIAGAYALYKVNRKIFYLAIMLLLLWGGVMGSVSASEKTLTPEHRFIVEVFFLPLYLPIAMLLASGLKLLKDSLRGGVLRWFIPLAISLIPVLIILPSNYPSVDRTKNFSAYDYGRDLMNSMPPKSILVTNGDNPAFATSYLKSVERYREDIVLTGSSSATRWFLLAPERRVVDQQPMYPELFKRGWWINTGEIRTLTTEGFKVFYSDPNTPLKADRITLLFHGAVYLLVPNEIFPGAMEHVSDRLDDYMSILSVDRMLEIPDASKDYFSWLVSYQYSNLLLRYGHILEEKDIDKAKETYKLAFRMTPIYNAAEAAYTNSTGIKP